ncbi:hypothetical protein BT96DRAFT_1005252 [Gymnopus androsaceus JB14]|uniref:Uncharacterized protein n=1 Tax=Gymnopus androsaceus JB14 TaxID=1447944 RepID=A0A6A4GNG1_9AGAR|nr:hypothetical protein BT96DRAFT_1005252 [Gymnopus androsaceus JB14]
MSQSLSVKHSVYAGSAFYFIKSPSQTKLQSTDLSTLLSKIFLHDFSTLHALTDQNLIEILISENHFTFDSNVSYDICALVLAVLEGRGYVSTVLDVIFSAQSTYTSSVSNGLPPPGSINDCKHLSRKQACIQHVQAEVNDLEYTRDTWPQPVDQSTIMECIKSYGESIKYVLLSVCASCGAEDRERTGSFVPLQALPSLDNLHVKNQQIIDHTPCAHFTDLNPIAIDDLDERPYRLIDNTEVPNTSLDPLVVFEVLSVTFSYEEMQIFRAAMIADSAIIVGSCAMAAISRVAMSAPCRLDMLVGFNGGKALYTALGNFG